MKNVIGLSLLVFILTLTLPYALLAQTWQWEPDSSFFRPVDLPLPEAIRTYNAADMLGDSRSELIFATPDSLCLLQNLANPPDISWEVRPGYFSGVSVPYGVTTVTAVDFMNNTNPEILMTDYSGQEITVYTNTGDQESPIWQQVFDPFPGVSLPGSSFGIALCELDNDGFLDLLLAYDFFVYRYEVNNWGIWEHRGNMIIFDNMLPDRIEAADGDGDGDTDLFLLCNMPCMWLCSYMVENVGNPTSPAWADPVQQLRWGVVTPGEVDGDGWVDLFDNGRSWRPKAPPFDSLCWNPPILWGTLECGPSLLIYDIEGDGTPEIATSGTFGSWDVPHYILEQYTRTDTGWRRCNWLGSEFEGSGMSGAGCYYRSQLVDMDSDGRMDLVLFGLGPGWFLSLYWNRGDSFGSDWVPDTAYFDGLDPIGYPTFGDLDGDGDQDVLVRSMPYWSFGQHEAFANTGTAIDPQWTRRTDWELGIPDSIFTAGLVDLDQDGDLDLVLGGGRNPYGFVLMENTGGINFPSWNEVPGAFDGISTYNPTPVFYDLDNDGRLDLFCKGVVWMNHSVGVEHEPVTDGLPYHFGLSARPNPFNPSTIITYSINYPGVVQLSIYDPLGRLVRTLIEEQKSPGEYSVVWNGMDNRMMPCPSGIYFCHITVGEFTLTKRMVLLK